MCKAARGEGQDEGIRGGKLQALGTWNSYCTFWTFLYHYSSSLIPWT